jgi:protein dithiol oxidoreductase (disulfide-forming)
MTLPRRTLLASAFLPLGALPVMTLAQEAFSVEGRYETLSTPQPTSTPDKVEVVEIFWYGCPHCNRFQAYIDPWQETRPDFVEFMRMPAVFQPQWEVHARAYYTAVAMGVLDRTHAPLFGAIHTQNRALDSRESLEEFFVQQGIDASEFSKHYDSFGVDAAVRRSKVMQGRYGIRGVPAVVVNGKYRISGAVAGSYPNMIKVIDALVAREHKEMVAKS